MGEKKEKKKKDKEKKDKEKKEKKKKEKEKATVRSAPDGSDNNSADIFCKVPKFQACNKGKDLSTRTLVPISFSRLVGGAAV